MQLPNRFQKFGIQPGSRRDPGPGFARPRNETAKKPLIMCSTLFDVQLDIPYDISLPKRHNERTAWVEDHLKCLHAGDLVIGDRGYFSQELGKTMQRNGIDVLLRVKEAACKCIFKFVTSRRSERIVSLSGLM